jgi:hypothetical protein
MGLSPRETGNLTFWEFHCLAEGWLKIHDGKPAITYPTDEEFERAVAMH